MIIITSYNNYRLFYNYGDKHKQKWYGILFPYKVCLFQELFTMGICYDDLYYSSIIILCESCSINIAMLYYVSKTTYLACLLAS